MNSLSIETQQNPWSPTLRHAAWFTLAIAGVFIVIQNSNALYDSVGAYLNYQLLERSIFGMVVVSIVAMLIASAIRKVPPLSDTKFWVSRAISDSVLAFGIIPIFLLPMIIISFSALDMGDRLTTSNALLNFANAIEISPRTFFILTIVAQFTLGTIVLLRMLFKAFPAGLLHISFKHLRKDGSTALLYSIPLIIGGFLYDEVLKRFGIDIPPQFVFNDEFQSQFLLIILGGVAGAAVFEELFFRGYLLSIMAKKKPWLGLVVSSLIFSAVHLHLIYFPLLFLVGIILGIAYLRTNNILVPMTIHALNNLIAFGILFFS